VSNLSTENIDEEDNQSEVADELGTFDDSMQSEQHSEANEPNPSCSTVEPETTQHKHTLSTDSKIKKKMKQSDALVEVLNKRSEERKRLMEELTSIEDDDPIDVFFKSMALTVKQLSPELKIKAKLDVLRIVSELELKNDQPKETMSAPRVQTQSSTNYEFPEVMRPYPPENHNMKNNSYPNIDNYTTSTSFDSEYSEKSGEYWFLPSNK